MARAWQWSVCVAFLAGCFDGGRAPLHNLDGGGPLRRDGGFASGGGHPFPCADGGSFGGGPADAGNEALVIPAKQPPPISGGTLTVLADQTVVAADSDRDEVWLLPSASMTADRVALNPGDEPGRVIEGPAGRVFVALRGAAAVAELDVTTRTVVTRHSTCASPRGLGWVAAESTLAVACATGELSRVVFANGVAVSRTTTFIASDLRDVVVRGDRLLVSTFRAAHLLQVSNTGAVSPNYGPFSNDAGVPRVAWRTVDTRNGVVMLYQQQSIAGLSGSCGASYGGSGFGELPVHPMFDFPELNSPAVALPPPLAGAVDVAVAPDGLELAFATPGAWLVARATGSGGMIAVHADVGQPVAVAYRGSALVIQSREPAALHVVSPTGRTEIRLGTDSRKSTGHDLFHRMTPNRIACASCHPEGGDDGHVWILPEGRRRTPTLRGGLSTTAPFHWDAAFRDMNQLFSEIMVRRMGGFPQSQERVGALLQWLDSVPKLPGPALDAAAVERGRVVFENATVACASCHVGAQGTNNLTMSVGTGAALQVPRLVELGSRAPYFHDGRVPTLEQRFTELGGDAHGTVSGLSPAQITDLVTYLKSR